MRAQRIPALVLPLLVFLGLLAANSQGVPTVRMSPEAAVDHQPTLPVTATVFYAPQAKPASRVHQTRITDYQDVESIHHQVDDMIYAGQQVGIYSWFGRGSYPDRVFANHLRAADDTAFRWALLDENEGGGGNPSVAAIRADLDSIYSRFGKDPSYFRIGGRPVLFTYGDAGDTCNAAARWRTADSSNRFFLVMKVVKGYAGCRPQPSSWYAYAPAEGRFATGNSFGVSPGFDAISEPRARLGRSLTRFVSDLRAMKASSARFKITTTWNEWSQATSVESAFEWRSRSGHGAYVDQMHAVLGQAPGVPAAPVAPTATTLGQTVALRWPAVAGASAYQVFRNGCLVAQVPRYFNDTSMTDSSASYAVKSVGARGTSRLSVPRVGIAGQPTPFVDPGGDGLVGLPGQRILSTVTGGGIGCKGRIRGQSVVTLPSTVPANATAVMLAITSFSAQGNGSVTVFASGRSAPPIAQVRYYVGRPSTNTTLVPVGIGKQLILRTDGAATQLYVDLVGYAAPGVSRPIARSATQFYNSRSTSRSLGGTSTKKVQGTVTFPLPAVVPSNATAVQVRIVVQVADGPGSATVWSGGGSPPSLTLAYVPGGMEANSVLVPVNGQRTVTFTVTRNASVSLAVEGWSAPGGQSLVVAAPVRLAAPAGIRTSYDVTIPDRSLWGNGHLVMLSLAITHAQGEGMLTVTSVGDPAPGVRTIGYGSQQPQSGFMWARIPASGVLHLSLSTGAVIAVDQLAVA